MGVVLNKTVVDSGWCFDNLCGSLFRVVVSRQLMVLSSGYTIDLIGQLGRNVMGRLSVKLWCYRLQRANCHWLVDVLLNNPTQH